MQFTTLGRTGLRVSVAGLGCGGGSRLAVRQVVPEGRRLMTAAEFLRGSPIRLGSRLVAADDTAGKSR